MRWSWAYIKLSMYVMIVVLALRLEGQFVSYEFYLVHWRRSFKEVPSLSRMMDIIVRNCLIEESLI